MAQEDKSITTPTFFNTGMIEDLKKERPENLNIEFGAGSSVQSALRAIDESREFIEKTENVRVQNLKDPTNTPAAAKLKTYEFAQKAKKEIYDRAEKSETGIRNVINQIDEKINGPIQGEAGSRQANEIRSHLKSLKDEPARITFVRDRIKAQDWETVSAAIGSKFFLAGLSEDSQKFLQELYQQARFADKIQVRNYLERVADNIGNGYKAAVNNIDKAVDDPEIRKIQALHQQAKTAMES